MVPLRVCVCVCGFSACLSHARQNNYMSSCPFGCCNLLCVCGFPPSDPPHTQAIPYTSNSMPKGAHLGFMILCVCVWISSLWPHSTTHKHQLHGKLPIWMLKSLVCVVSLPLTHHTHKQFHAKRCSYMGFNLSATLGFNLSTTQWASRFNLSTAQCQAESAFFLLLAVSGCVSSLKHLLPRL